MELFDNKFRRKKNKIKLTSDKIDKKKSCNIKFQKKFSKLKFINPFLNCFRFHQDSILNVLPHPKLSNIIFTSSADGEICSWILNKERCLFSLKAHEKSVKGLSIDRNGKFLLSCSDDSFLKVWKILENKKEPFKIYKNETNLNSIDFNPLNSYFITTGKVITMWDFERFLPIQILPQKWTTTSCAKFNPVEYNILLSSASDRSITIHDLRTHSPVKKFFMEMRSNDLVWFKTNPWEFTLANEDSNLYTFDLRKISHVKKIFKGHVMAVQSLDQDERSGFIISGSLDRTIRVHKLRSDFNSEALFSSRMSRVLCVSFSLDCNLIFSGSEDGNLRVWKKPVLEENVKHHLKKKCKTNEKRHLSFKSNQFYQKPFLPKIIINIKKIKTRLAVNDLQKKTRLNENVLPGLISCKEKLKKPLIKLKI